MSKNNFHNELKPATFATNYWRMTNQATENYLKCIYALASKEPGSVSTNAIAERLNTKASSVTDMLKKLKDKGLVEYEKYQGAELTDSGRAIAVQIIRKHRLWEVFLVQKLKFGWDEVHDIAEQLEHIKSPDLVTRLDDFLGHPKYDPHGDPIPDADGHLATDPEVVPISKLDMGQTAIIVGVGDSSPAFLQYLQQIDLTLGAEVSIENKFDFDSSMSVTIGGQTKQISAQVCDNLLVKTR